jgi:hypothetical protein
VAHTGRGDTHYAGDGCMPDHAEELAGLRLRPGDQPLPAAGRGPFMHDLLLADLRRNDHGSPAAVVESMCADVEARRQLGITRYGRALQAHNGRNARQDGYDEMLDFLVYALQVMQEVPVGSTWAARASSSYDTVLQVATTWRTRMLEDST